LIKLKKSHRLITIAENIKEELYLQEISNA